MRQLNGDALGHLRIAAGAHWNPNKDVPKSWYFPIPQGYTDYPTLPVAA